MKEAKRWRLVQAFKCALILDWAFVRYHLKYWRRMRELDRLVKEYRR